MNAKTICLIAAVILALSRSLFAAGGKTYEITGTVVAATGTTLVVEKGAEKYEFSIDPATIKGSAELKAGSAITVTYVMSATKIEQAAASSTKTESKASTSPASSLQSLRSDRGTCAVRSQILGGSELDGALTSNSEGIREQPFSVQRPIQEAETIAPNERPPEKACL
jgi:hypothetical protein